MPFLDQNSAFHFLSFEGVFSLKTYSYREEEQKRQILQNVINSENLRRCRPVVSRISRKDPRPITGSIEPVRSAYQLAFPITDLAANSFSLEA